jgi:hypothetical protein
MTKNDNRTSSYLFTVNLSNPADVAFLKAYRELWYGTGKYVKLQGRWGKKNPAWNQRQRPYHKGCPLSSAVSADAYLYDR